MLTFYLVLLTILDFICIISLIFTLVWSYRVEFYLKKGLIVFFRVVGHGEIIFSDMEEFLLYFRSRTKWKKFLSTILKLRSCLLNLALSFWVKFYLFFGLVKPFLQKRNPNRVLFNLFLDSQNVKISLCDLVYFTLIKGPEELSSWW